MDAENEFQIIQGSQKNGWWPCPSCYKRPEWSWVPDSSPNIEVAWINLIWNPRKWAQCGTFLWSWKKRDTAVRTPLYVGINILTSPPHKDKACRPPNEDWFLSVQPGDPYWGNWKTHKMRTLHEKKVPVSESDKNNKHMRKCIVENGQLM